MNYPKIKLEIYQIFVLIDHIFFRCGIFVQCDGKLSWNYWKVIIHSKNVMATGTKRKMDNENFRTMEATVNFFKLEIDIFPNVRFYIITNRPGNLYLRFDFHFHPYRDIRYTYIQILFPSQMS